MNRYRVAADRAWRAAWKDVETLRKNRLQTIRRAESLKDLLSHRLANLAVRIWRTLSKLR
jgi:hypothetical protein